MIFSAIQISMIVGRESRFPDRGRKLYGKHDNKTVLARVEKVDSPIGDENGRVEIDHHKRHVEKVDSPIGDENICRIQRTQRTSIGRESRFPDRGRKYRDI